MRVPAIVVRMGSVRHVRQRAWSMNWGMTRWKVQPL